MLQGIDIASYQGLPDFAQVAASGVSFVVTKATEGTGYVNPTFCHNWLQSPAAGLARAAYHFARPDESGPEAQASFFLHTLGPLSPGDVLVLDLESGSGNVLNWTLGWLRAVWLATGARPLLYSGTWFMEPHGLTGNAELSEYGLWLAAYQSAPPSPPPNWPFWAIWQYSDKGIVPGIAGPVDLDYFNGDDISRFKAYGVP